MSHSPRVLVAGLAALTLTALPAAASAQPGAIPAATPASAPSASATSGSGPGAPGSGPVVPGKTNPGTATAGQPGFGASAARTSATGESRHFRHRLGREVLPDNDGWAAYGSGTTGGTEADHEHVYTVHNRSEFVQALGGQGNNTPKIIKIRGTIDANVDNADRPLTCEDYAEGTGYSLDGYLEAYDPETWGYDREPEGPLEDARQRAAEKQSEQITLTVPSNTTIVGVGRNPTVDGASLLLDGQKSGQADNIIIRNLTFINPVDCFPQWDPTDGSEGSWNAEFDTVRIVNGATHVWVDHNTFTDAPHLDENAPMHFGQTFQQHDGATDVTNASDFVTVSWNVYADHDKTLLIGSTDSDRHDDASHLRVTLHHNEFRGIGQRAPRLRWGKNDVYNNYYVVNQAEGYGYSWGVGVFSHIYAEKNYFRLADDVSPATIIGNYRGTEIHESGNLVNGRPVDLLAAHNAENDPDLTDDDSWTPHLRTRVHPAWAVPHLVRLWAGADHLR